MLPGLTAVAADHRGVRLTLARRAAAAVRERELVGVPADAPHVVWAGQGPHRETFVFVGKSTDKDNL
jgi:hypothetical protein